MSQPQEIAVQPRNQSMVADLAGVTYRLRVLWNTTLARWVLDIDDADGVALVHGIPLVTGSDLLGQFRHLGFPGSLYCGSDGDLERAPGYADFGTTSHLWFQADEATAP